MTTQAQGKGRKKNKEVMKVALDDFKQIDAPHGHSVNNFKMAGLDWTASIADYNQQATETQQIIVPTTPRQQRRPGVDFNSLPKEPPFRVSLFNVPMSVEEKDIVDRFFLGIEVVRVDSTKSSTTVELASKQDLYDALCKDGSNLKNRTIDVCLFGESPSQSSYGSDRYGGRGGNSSYGDRYGDRGQGGGFGGQRAGDKYGDRDRGAGSFGRDIHSGFNRGGFSQQRGGFGDRYNDGSNSRDTNRSEYISEEPMNRLTRPVAKPTPPSASASATASPSASPSSYYAGAKFLSPPIPSLLPMPPKSWLRDLTSR